MLGLCIGRATYPKKMSLRGLEERMRPGDDNKPAANSTTALLPLLYCRCIFRRTRTGCWPALAVWPLAESRGEGAEGAEERRKKGRKEGRVEGRRRQIWRCLAVCRVAEGGRGFGDKIFNGKNTPIREKKVCFLEMEGLSALRPEGTQGLALRTEWDRAPGMGQTGRRNGRRR